MCLCPTCALCSLHMADRHVTDLQLFFRNWEGLGGTRVYKGHDSAGVPVVIKVSANAAHEVGHDILQSLPSALPCQHTGGLAAADFCAQEVASMFTACCLPCIACMQVLQAVALTEIMSVVAGCVEIWASLQNIFATHLPYFHLSSSLHPHSAGPCNLVFFYISVLVFTALALLYSIGCSILLTLWYLPLLVLQASILGKLASDEGSRAVPHVPSIIYQGNWDRLPPQGMPHPYFAMTPSGHRVDADSSTLSILQVRLPLC